jgi:DNA-directed RNA polymerase subunit RPC12/RpoP
MSGRCTFGDRFQQALEEQIARGGKVLAMVNLVAAYQGTNSEAREAAFREWLEHELFLCERCGAEFSGRRDDVDEHDEVVCSWCRHGVRLGEPVRGWHRTWAR